MATKKAAKKRVPTRTLAARSGEKRGPKADVLKIKGDWQYAMKQSLKKKKPVDGWPN